MNFRELARVLLDGAASHCAAPAWSWCARRSCSRGGVHRGVGAPGLVTGHRLRVSSSADGRSIDATASFRLRSLDVAIFRHHSPPSSSRRAGSLFFGTPAGDPERSRRVPPGSTWRPFRVLIPSHARAYHCRGRYSRRGVDPTLWIDAECAGVASARTILAGGFPRRDAPLSSAGGCQYELSGDRTSHRPHPGLRMSVVEAASGTASSWPRAGEHVAAVIWND